MKELNDLIVARMNNMTESGVVEKLIDAQLQDSIKNILSESLRSYSDFGKEIKAKLDESLAGAVSKVSFPEYNKYVSDAVVRCVSEHFSAEVVSSIQERIKDELQPAPKEIKGSVMLRELGRFFDHDSPGVEFEDSPYIPINWSINDSNTAIYMKVNDLFKVTFYDHKNNGQWFIGYIEDESEMRITADLGGATHAHGVIGYLYKLYCTGTIIEDIDVCCDHEEYISVN